MKAQYLNSDRQWIGDILDFIPDNPPYDNQMQVTPLSTFELNVWRYPKHWLPPGSHHRDTLDFLGDVLINGQWESLDETDQCLLLQMKEFMVASIFRRSLLTTKRGTSSISKVRTISRDLLTIRRFFVALKLQGLKSLRQFDQAILDAALSSIDAAPASFDQISKAIARLKTFVDHGLISDIDKFPEHQITAQKVAVDTARSIGAPALSDSDLAKILKISRRYVEHAEELIALAENYRWSNKVATKNRFLKLVPYKGKHFGSHLPSKIVTSLQIACYNFVGWHLGARISEVLSLKRGFAVPVAGSTILQIEAVEMTAETYKAVFDSEGDKRVFEVHPYLARVCGVLEKVADFCKASGQEIFIGYESKELLTSDNFNAKLQRFLFDHEVDAEISTHSWRNTLVAVTVRSVKDALGPLCHLLGHKSVNTAIGYAFSNPFVRADLRKSLEELADADADRLLSGTRFFGGGGYAGKQGKSIEASVVEMSGRGMSDAEIKTHLKAEMDKKQISTTYVDVGIECTKPRLSKGLCTKGRGDILADATACTSECPFRTEARLARSELLKTILSIPAEFSKVGVTPLMKMERAGEISDRLKSWPDLVPVLMNTIREDSNISNYFEEIIDGIEQ